MHHGIRRSNKGVAVYWSSIIALFTSASCLSASMAAEATDDQLFRIDIPAQSLVSALDAFSKQTGVPTVFVGTPPTDAVMSKPVAGYLTTSQILARLTGDFDVAFRTDEQAFALTPRVPDEVVIKAGPEVLALRSSLNVDLVRIDGGNLPLMSFGKDDMRMSHASDGARFLRDNLLNASFGTPDNPLSGGLGTTQEINLRGFGASQTLVLIDGHPMARLSLGGVLLQTNIGVVPLESMARIDVLPAAASALYGPGAVGGVVNIVLERDYTGLDLQVNIEHPKNSSADALRAVARGGARFLDDALLVSGLASVEQREPMPLRERDLLSRGRKRIEANHPGYFDDQPTPPLGSAINGRFDANVDACGGNLAVSFSAPRDYDPAQGLSPLCSNNHYSVTSAPTAQFDGGDRLSVLGETRRASMMGTLRYQVTPLVSTDLDAFWFQERRSWFVSGAEYTLPHGVLWPGRVNPWKKDVRLTFSTSIADGWMRALESGWRLASGVQLILPRAWKLRVSYAWSESSVALSRPVLDLDADAWTSGTLNPFAESFETALGSYLTTWRMTPIRATTGHAYMLIGGQLTELRGRAVNASVSLEHREERSAVGGATESLDARSGRDSIAINHVSPRLASITSASGHLQLPVTGKGDVDLDVRWDQYAQRWDMTGAVGERLHEAPPKISSLSAQFAIGYKVTPLARLKASCATGWTPPPPEQLTPPDTSIGPRGLLVGVLDGIGYDDTVSIVSGGNSQLGAEHSYSCSAGAVLASDDTATSSQSPRWQLSMDYTETERRDAIYMPIGLLYTDPNRFASLFADQITVVPDGSVNRVSVTATSLNASRQGSGTLNLLAHYAWSTTSGLRFSSQTLVNYNTHFFMQLTPEARKEDRVGVTSAFPLRYQISSRIVADRAPWQVGWQIRYFPAYLVSVDTSGQSDLVRNQGGSHVSSQDYHEIFGRWSFETIDVQVGVQNVFDQRPSFDAGARGYSSAWGIVNPTTFYISVRKTM